MDVQFEDKVDVDFYMYFGANIVVQKVNFAHKMGSIYGVGNIPFGRR